MSDLQSDSDQLGDTSKFAQITDKIISSISTEDKKEKSIFENRKISERFNLISNKQGFNESEMNKTNLTKRQKPNKDKRHSSVQKSTDVLSSSLIEREKQRDLDLKLKLQQLSLKQSARIKEIREAEERQKDAELQRLLLSAKREFNEEVSKRVVTSPITIDEQNKTQQNSNAAYQKTVQQIIEAGDPRKLSEKSYFNIKVNDSQVSNNEKSNRTHSYHKSRANQLPNDVTNSTMLHSISQRSINAMTTNQSVNWGTKVNRTREDISFLKEPSLPNISTNFREKGKFFGEGFDKSTYGLLASQSQITSGDPSQDEYFQVALGLRAIGKSIIDLPKSIEDLRLISKQYQKNISAVEQTQDEQIYLSYIEEHYLAASKRDGETQELTLRGNSPIRDLQEYYAKMLNKLNIQEGTTTARPRLNKTKQVQSAANLNIAMTADEVINFEKSPPKIDTNRKRMMLIENTVMNQFGQEAFRINLNSQDQVKKLNLSPQASPRREKTLLTKEHQHSKDREVDKKKLLKSLADHEDQLVRSSINKEEDSNKHVPSWMNRSEFPNLTYSKDLGKPSARQDAVLLAKWFHEVIEVVEQESIASQLKRQKLQDQNKGRLFTNLKASENEISSVDSFHYVQLIHNIAIKEVTRQISVQCIERGILLKTIFDSYVRLVDLIYSESLNLRRSLANKFALIFEKQLKMHQTELEKQIKVTFSRDKTIEELNLQLATAEKREQGIRATNKKMVKIALRNEGLWEQEQKEKASFERQVHFLEERLIKLQEQLDPSRLDMLQKEIKRSMNKIQRETIRDHQPMRKDELLGGAQNKADFKDEYKLKNEDIIREANKATTMAGFTEHLEDINGGPLKVDAPVEAIAETAVAELEPMNFKLLGLFHDVQTEVDDDWRRVTRIRKARRAKSQMVNPIVGVLPQDKQNDSDCTSTHTQLQYRERNFSKTFVHVIPISQRVLPVLKKRSLSMGAVNQNKLIQKQINKLKREKNLKLTQAINADPSLKLRFSLGDAMLKHVQESNAKLFSIIYDNALKAKNGITPAFCQEIIAEMASTKSNVKTPNNKTSFVKGNASDLNPQSNPAKKQKRTEPLKLNQKHDTETHHQTEDQKLVNVESKKMSSLSDRKEDLSPIKKISSPQGKEKIKTTKRSKEKNKETKFKEFTFQNKKEKPNTTPLAEHPSIAMVAKMNKRRHKPIENKDLMPPKTLSRYINVIYAQRTIEMGGNRNKPEKDRRGNTISPERNKQRALSNENHSDNSLIKSPKANLDVNRASQYKSNTAGFTNRSVSKDDAQIKDHEPSMVEYVYDYMQQRYGLKAVADKKFNQLMYSSIKYKDKSPRIRMFGRFLDLYDSLSSKDFKLYIEIQEALFKMVLNFQIQEGDEVALIPLGRANDYFKLTFGVRLTNQSLNYCLKQIKNKAVFVSKSEEQKYLHLNNVKEAVSLDLFAEMVINTINSLQNEKIQNIEDLFHAADMSATGVISYDEFRTLYKLIVIQSDENTDEQLEELKRLFDEYADLHDDFDDNRKPQRGLDKQAFQRLCLEKEIFTIKAQNNFINQQQKAYLNVTESQDAFSAEFQKLKENLDSIYESLQNAINEHLSQGVSERDRKRYLEMVDQMAKCVMYPVNQKIAFLTFKIVVETIKRAVLKSQVEKYLPVDSARIKEAKMAITETQHSRSGGLNKNSIMSKLGNALIRKYGIMQTTNIKDFNTGPDQTSSNEKFKMALANVQRLKTSQTTKSLAPAPEIQFRSESKSEFEQTPQQLNSMFKSYDHKDGMMRSILKMQGIYEKYPPENRQNSQPQPQL